MTKLTGPKKINTAVFISGTGTNLKNLIKFSLSKNSPIKIIFVLSNNQKAKGLQFSKKNGIESKVYNFSKKKIIENKILNDLKKRKIRLICLAGFMEILSKNFIKRFRYKILNIHPSLLPKYPGLNTHTKVIENKDIYHGISIHYVSSELDAGPIIAQGKIDVKVNESLERLEDRIHKLEHITYPKIIDLICKNEIYLENDSVRYRHNTGSKEYICDAYEI